MTSIPSPTLIPVLIYFNESYSKPFKLLPTSTISQIKCEICESEDLEASKTRVRLIEETSGTTALKQLSESSTVQSSIPANSKLAFDKIAKRVVRFVESDDDKVIEISLKAKSSTVPSTSCHSDTRDLSEIEEDSKRKKKSLRIKRLSLILKNLKLIQNSL